MDCPMVIHSDCQTGFLHSGFQTVSLTVSHSESLLTVSRWGCQTVYLQTVSLMDFPMVNLMATRWVNQTAYPLMVIHLVSHLVNRMDYR